MVYPDETATRTLPDGTVQKKYTHSHEITWPVELRDLRTCDGCPFRQGQYESRCILLDKTFPKVVINGTHQQGRLQDCPLVKVEEKFSDPIPKVAAPECIATGCQNLDYEGGFCWQHHGDPLRHLYVDPHQYFNGK
jgi:hypothetical protein